MKKIIKFLKDLGIGMLRYLFKILWGIPTAYMIAWASDILFDTMWVDNWIVIYITLILIIPMLKVQFTSYKSEKESK